MSNGIKSQEKSVAKFSTYAYYYVLGEVTKYIRENKAIRVSRDIIRKNQTIERGRDALRQKLQREPSDLELSLLLEIPEEEIVNARNAVILMKSLDEELADSENVNYYNSVKVYDPNMDSCIMDLHQEVERLNQEEQQFIYDRYYNGYTQSEISRDLGISQAQVSRKENKILEKLRSRL